VIGMVAALWLASPGGLADPGFTAEQPAQASQAQQDEQQSVPDAPSASRPAQTFPAPEAGDSLPSGPQPSTKPQPQPGPAASAPAEPPKPEVTAVPPGGAANVAGSPRDQLYTLTRNVNFVIV